MKSIPQKSNRLLTGSIISLILFLTIPLFYSYQLVPDKQEVDFYFFTYKSLYYQSIYALAWALVQKLIIILIIFIWYITNENWWRYALGAPALMFIYQSIFMVVEDSKPQDEFMNSWYFVVPTSIFILLILHLSSVMIKRKIQIVNINRVVDEEIDNILKNR